MALLTPAEIESRLHELDGWTYDGAALLKRFVFADFAAAIDFMDDDAAQFTGSIPQYYDTGLGPVIFTHYADVVAGLVADGSPQRILETAAGTGLSSRAIAIANPGAELIVTDLNAPMLEFARAKLPEGTRVETADAQALPFDDASFDTVVCQFGVMEPVS